MSQCERCGGRGKIANGTKTVGGSRPMRNGPGCGSHLHIGGRTVTNYEKCPNCKGSGKKGGCFISSATYSSLGKDDNCYELTILRKYRDEYIKEKFPELLEEYYEKSPEIVISIDKQPNKEEEYKIISEKINNCIFYIENKEYQYALDEYSSLFENLSNKFGIKTV